MERRGPDVPRDVMVSTVGTEHRAGDGIGDLAEALAREVPEVETRRLREDPLTQDAGTTLVLVLGTPAVTALAHGLAAWLRRRSDTRIRLRHVREDGSTIELEADGRSAQDVAGAIRAYLASVAEA